MAREHVSSLEHISRVEAEGSKTEATFLDGFSYQILCELRKFAKRQKSNYLDVAQITANGLMFNHEGESYSEKDSIGPIKQFLPYSVLEQFGLLGSDNEEYKLKNTQWGTVEEVEKYRKELATSLKIKNYKG